MLKCKVETRTLRVCVFPKPVIYVQMEHNVNLLDNYYLTAT